MRRQSIEALLIQVLFVLFVFVPVSLQAAPGDDAESIRLIKAYTNAVETNDLVQIKAAWNDLNNNKVAVEYMQKNMPRLTYLFQVRGLYFQMADIDAKRAEALAAQQRTGPEAEAVTTQVQGTGKTPATVEPFSVSEPEANRLPTNGEIVARSQNA